MTRIRYRQAIVSFCANLTDPNASSVPIGVMLVAEDEKGPVAGGAVTISLKGDLDPLSRAVLSDVPKFLRQHLDDAVKSLPKQRPVGDVLVDLHHSLRNSLHVSEILDEREVEVGEEPADLTQKLVTIMVATLAPLREAAEPRPKSFFGLGGSTRKKRTAASLPESSLWPIAAHAQ